MDLEASFGLTPVKCVRVGGFLEETPERWWLKRIVKRKAVVEENEPRRRVNLVDRGKYEFAT